MEGPSAVIGSGVFQRIIKDQLVFCLQRIFLSPLEIVVDLNAF